MKLYTRFLLVAGLMGGTYLGSFAQQRHTCGFNQKMESALQDPRVRAEHERMEAAYEDAVSRGSALRTSGGVRTIPVVVHIIQTSAQEVVTLDDVNSQIDVLNEDFRKLAGSAGDGGGVDMEYEFKLAKIDPNGCPTTGVNRVVSPANAFHDKADEAQLKALIQWPPNKYLNVWVPRTIETTSGSGQIIGYATFPSWITFQPQLDGIVIHSGYFGRDADPSTIGRTTTHEVGHWVGLYHTFQDGCSGSSSTNCLSGGDRVCDTPQAADQNFGCPNINSCTDTPTDAPDQIENYMDYSNGTCQNMFTAGQKTRADQICQNYRSNLWSASNLAATGVNGAPAPGCTPTANFSADQVVVCTGSSVNFTDISRGTPTGWSWTFNGGTPSTSTDQNPTVTYNTPGTYSVTLVANTGVGSDVEVKSSYVKVIDPAQPSLAEGFEGLSSGVPSNWYTQDFDQIGSWTLVPTVGSRGSGKCMKVKIFNTYSTYSVDNLNIAPVDFSNVITASLSYDYCYKKRSGFTFDSLLVNISTDCGATWTNLRTRVQSSLVTVAGLQSATEFVPTPTSNWFGDTLDLTPYAGNPAVRIQFQAIGMDGQSIYLDNINLNTTLVNVEDQVWNQGDFQVGPNPFEQNLQVVYNLTKSGTTQFDLMDLSGRVLVSQNTGMKAAGTHRFSLDESLLQNIAPGAYLLRGSGPNGVAIRKVIKM